MAGGIANANGAVLVTGCEKDSAVWKMIRRAAADVANIRRFDLLDEGVEWAEDQLIYRYGGYTDARQASTLDQQALLAGLSTDAIAELAALATPRSFHTGERIVAAGEPATSIYFIMSGMVSVKLQSGVRLASLSYGMVFGEMALIEERRSADVWADTPVTCLELGLKQFDEFSDRYRRAGQRIVRNLADLLSKRLIQANPKLDVLSTY
jgi:glutaminase